MQSPFTSTGVPQLPTILNTNSGTPDPDFSNPTIDGRSPPTAEQRKASHSAPHNLNTQSCVAYRKRKVKCDKQDPCLSCTKIGIECVFPALRRVVSSDVV
ncbi:hypothetical protein DL98DRAFT_633726 [Cadophora sp. DSE1049]|nr:hypothetical protein DL98DRAFT_633726 [Cadophora sp. DSE1049]